MADRFPSLDQIDAGKALVSFFWEEKKKKALSFITSQLGPFKNPITNILAQTGQTEPRGDASFEVVGESADTNDFLSRERALLGDDADQFATPNDNAATVEDAGEDDEDDLLGGGNDGDGFGQQGGGGGGGSDMVGFESSFPAIDASNEVCLMVDRA